MLRTEQMEKLIISLGDGLWTFCLRLTYSKLEAEDLYQDTMLKALELKEKIDFDKNPKAFIYSLAVSINNNRFRKIFRRKRIAPTFHSDYDFVEDSEANIESEIIIGEEKDAINVAIKKLSKNLKPVILMFYMEDLTIKDISKYLNIPEGTVKSRLNTGRNNLKKELEGIGYER